MKIKKSLLGIAAVYATLICSQNAFAFTAVGIGSVPIASSDPQSVKNIAEKKAIADAVLQAVKKTLGSLKVPADHPGILQLTQQQDTFLKSSPKIERDRSDSATYAVKVTLEIDDAAFVDALRDVRLGALSNKTKNLGSVIVFIDEAVKIDQASSSQVPMDERIDYKRDNSSSYKENSSRNSASASASNMRVSDKASASFSAKNSASGKANAAASYDAKYAGSASSRAAISENGVSVYGRDDAAVAASQRGSARQSASYANSSEAKMAQSKNYQASASSSSNKNSSSSKNVKNNVTDKEEFHYARTVNIAALKPQSTLNDAMKNELKAILNRFGVQFEDGSGLLADFEKTTKKRYSSYAEAMRSNGDNFKKFMRLKRPEASYIGIGTLEIGYNPEKDNVGDFRCGLNTGTISIAPLKSNIELPGGTLKTLKVSDAGVEGCMNNVRVQAATELGAKIGSLIQKNARDKDLESKQEMFD